MKMDEAPERRIRLLSAAGLIAGFYSGSSIREIYSSVVTNYETLLSIIEDPDTAAEVSRIMGLPVERIKEITEAIIVRLIFNKSNDPFVSLGLKHSVSQQEAHKRWKRLIMLYHPDKQNGSGIKDDKAKRINEAFTKLNKITKEGVTGLGTNINPIAPGGKKAEVRTEVNREYLQPARYIPRVILFSVVLLAAFMLSFCAYRVASVTNF